MKTINGCLIFRHPFVFLRPLFLRFLVLFSLFVLSFHDLSFYIFIFSFCAHSSPSFYDLFFTSCLFVPTLRPLFVPSFSFSLSLLLFCPFFLCFSFYVLSFHPFPHLLFLPSFCPLFLRFLFVLSFYIFFFVPSFALFFTLSLLALPLYIFFLRSLLSTSCLLCPPFALFLYALFLLSSTSSLSTLLSGPLYSVCGSRGGRPCGRPTADCRSCSGMLPAIFSTRRFRETLYRSAEAGFFCLSVQMAALSVPMAAGIFRRARCPAAATAGITPRFADGWRRTRRCCGRIR